MLVVLCARFNFVTLSANAIAMCSGGSSCARLHGGSSVLECPAASEVEERANVERFGRIYSSGKRLAVAARTFLVQSQLMQVSMSIEQDFAGQPSVRFSHGQSNAIVILWFAKMGTSRSLMVKRI